MLPVAGSDCLRATTSRVSSSLNGARRVSHIAARVRRWEADIKTWGGGNICNYVPPLPGLEHSCKYVPPPQVLIYAGRMRAIGPLWYNHLALIMKLNITSSRVFCIYIFLLMYIKYIRHFLTFNIKVSTPQVIPILLRLIVTIL